MIFYINNLLFCDLFILFMLLKINEQFALKSTLGGFSLIRYGAILCMLLWMTCYQYRVQWATEVLYHAEEKVQTHNYKENSLFILPLITNGKYLPQETFDIKKVINKNVTMINYNDIIFMDDILDLFEKNGMELSLLDSFFQDYSTNQSLDLMTDRSGWQYVPSKYLMSFNLKYGMNINSFDNKNKKIILVECVVWDCAQQEIIWRAETKGSYLSNRVTDPKFLEEGMIKILEKLPPNLFIESRDHW